MNQELYNEAVRSEVLSKKLIDQLLESMNYSSISFINWTVEVLRVIRTRLDRGDKIQDEVSGEIYTPASFHTFVKKNFLLTLKARSSPTLLMQKKYIFLWNHVKMDTLCS